MSDTTRKKNHISFLPALAIFAVACFIRYSRSYISTYNTTLFALNYDYGFLPQGLLGTVYNYLIPYLPWEMQNYIAVFNFNGLFTVVYFVALFCFYKACLTQVRSEDKNNMQHLMVLLSIFAFPMYMSSTNFGHTDLYIFILTFLGLILLVKGKMEWLIVPIGFLCTCIHEEYLFTHANLIVAILLYKILCGDNKKKKTYIAIVSLFVATVLGLFLYFNSFNYETVALYIEDIKAYAKLLSKSELTYNTFIVNGNILGLDMTYEEAPYYMYNVLDFPVFCVLFAPYIYCGFRFFIQLIKNKEASSSQRYAYLVFLLGGATLIPQFIFGIDYGRYIFHLLFYYIALLIIGLAMHNDTISVQLQDLKEDLKQLTPLHFVWFLYPFILTPLKGVTISTQIHDLAEVIFTEISFFMLPY